MPLKLSQLEVGDRVVLNCPKKDPVQARHKRVEYKGMKKGWELAAELKAHPEIIPMRGLAPFVSDQVYAEFAQLSLGEQVVQHQDGSVGLHGAVYLRSFLDVDEEGDLWDSSGLRVFIERRLPKDPAKDQGD